MAQHRYARYTSRDYGRTSSVSAILKTLGWEPLAERITMMYRIVHGLVDILALDHIIQVPPVSRRNGNAQFRVPYAPTLAYQRGIFPDGTRLWNVIPNLGREVWRLDLSPLHISLGRLFLTCLHCQGRKHAGTPKSVHMKLEASDVGACVRWLATGMSTRL